ncbi:MAG TPA: hypothetical protein VNX68_18415 [Nitrosopumilaceae archaeon]|nr:hypothetical protein [Nitrosopumilaceae archaeon]
MKKINSLIMPNGEFFQEWYIGYPHWKAMILASAVELLRWFVEHSPQDSINSDGEFSDIMREPLLDALGTNMATHGHYNTMVVPKLELLKEFTRLVSLGYTMTHDTNDILLIIDNVLRQADSWRIKTLELEREVHGPHWGKAFDAFSWSEYLVKAYNVLNEQTKGV